MGDGMLSSRVKRRFSNEVYRSLFDYIVRWYSQVKREYRLSRFNIYGIVPSTKDREMKPFALVVILSFSDFCKVSRVLGQHVWDGACGEPGRPEWAFLSRSGSARNANNGYNILQAVAPHIERGDAHELAATHRWLISLRHDDGEHYGAAVLIRAHPNMEESDIAITSASRCVDFQQGDVAVFRAHDVTENGVGNIQIAGCYPHHASRDPMTDEAFHMAILILINPVVFRNSMGPVCLPVPGQTVRIGDSDGFALGWNDPDDNNRFLLREIKLTVIDHAVYHELHNDPTGRTFYVDGREGETEGCSTDDYGAPFLRKVNNIYVMMGILVDAAPGPEQLNGLPSTMLRIAPFIMDRWLQNAIVQHSALWRQFRQANRGGSTSRAQRGH